MLGGCAVCPGSVPLACHHGAFLSPLLHMEAPSYYREVHLQLKLPKWPIMFIKTEKKKKAAVLSQLSEDQLSRKWVGTEPCPLFLSS